MSYSKYGVLFHISLTTSVSRSEAELHISIKVVLKYAKMKFYSSERKL